MSMIVGLYDDLATVEQVVNDLKANGFNQSEIHLATHDRRAQQKGSGGFFESLSDLFGRKPQDLGDQPKSLLHQITGWGIPENDAQQYAEAVRRGNTMLVVNANSDRIDNARQIMDGYSPIDIEERAAGWQQQGWQSYDETAQPFNEQQIQTERAQYARTTDRNVDREGETHIPIVEEEMRVGKRAVQRGGVRVHTTVTEQPIEETHTLRDETVNVERRPADRMAADTDLNDAFQERTIEVTETDEELVADKRARVTGEVVVSKQVEERPETVRDTVRRTEVHTEDLGAGQTTRTSRDFNTYATDFRSNYDMLYGSRGGDYSSYEPAYRYGYDLAGMDQYRGQKWSDIEPMARRDWERQHSGSAWENFKDAIRYSWERASSGRSDMSSGTTGFTGNEGYDTGRSQDRFTDTNR